MISRFLRKKGKEKKLLRLRKKSILPRAHGPQARIFDIKKTFHVPYPGISTSVAAEGKTPKKVRHKEAGTGNLNVLLEVLGARLQAPPPPYIRGTKSKKKHKEITP